MKKFIGLTIVAVALLVAGYSCCSSKCGSRRGKGEAEEVEEKKVESVVRLNDIWVLLKLEGEDAGEHFSGELPRLEFSIADKRIMGFGGCNNYFGSFEVSGDSLKIGPIGSTRMACDKMNSERKYFQLLEKSDRYEFEELRLTLLSESRPVLLFRKVD